MQIANSRSKWRLRNRSGHPSFAQPLHPRPAACRSVGRPPGRGAGCLGRLAACCVARPAGRRHPGLPAPAD
eukprot:1356778-Alexandrium_andersonii.AAC.1